MRRATTSSVVLAGSAAVLIIMCLGLCSPANASPMPQYHQRGRDGRFIFPMVDLNIDPQIVSLTDLFNGFNFPAIQPITINKPIPQIQLPQIQKPQVILPQTIQIQKPQVQLPQQIQIQKPQVQIPQIKVPAKPFIPTIGVGGR